MERRTCLAHDFRMPTNSLQRMALVVRVLAEMDSTKESAKEADQKTDPLTIPRQENDGARPLVADGGMHGYRLKEVEKEALWNLHDRALRVLCE